MDNFNLIKNQTKTMITQMRNDQEKDFNHKIDLLRERIAKKPTNVNQLKKDRLNIMRKKVAIRKKFQPWEHIVHFARKTNIKEINRVVYDEYERRNFKRLGLAYNNINRLPFDINVIKKIQKREKNEKKIIEKVEKLNRTYISFTFQYWALPDPKYNPRLTKKFNYPRIDSHIETNAEGIDVEIGNVVWEETILRKNGNQVTITVPKNFAENIVEGNYFYFYDVRDKNLLTNAHNNYLETEQEIIKRFGIEQILNVNELYPALKHYDEEYAKRLFYTMKYHRGLLAVSAIRDADKMEKAQEIDLLDQLLGKNQPKINYKFISYDDNAYDTDNLSKLIGDIDLNKYLKEQWTPNRCVYSVIINAYRDNFYKCRLEGRYKNVDFTYQYLWNLIHADAPYDENMMMEERITNMTPFFDKYHLKIIALDISYNVIYNYEGTGYPNNRLSPACLYVLIHNKHCYHLNDNLKELQQIALAPSQNNDNEVNVSPHYQLVKYEQYYTFIDNIKLLPNIMYDAPSNDNYMTVYYPYSVHKLVGDLIFIHKYEPRIKQFRGYIYSATIKVGKCYVNIVETGFEKDEKITFDDIKQDFCDGEYYNLYLSMEAKVYQSIITPQTLSRYADGFIEMMNNYSRAQIVGTINIPKHTKSCVYTKEIKIKDAEYDKANRVCNKKLKEFQSILYYISNNNRFRDIYDKNSTDRLRILDMILPQKINMTKIIEELNNVAEMVNKRNNNQEEECYKINEKMISDKINIIINHTGDNNKLKKLIINLFDNIQEQYDKIRNDTGIKIKKIMDDVNLTHDMLAKEEEWTIIIMNHIENKYRPKNEKRKEIKVVTCIEEEEEKYYEGDFLVCDVNKAYTSYLLQMEYFPVFNEFDGFKDYVKNTQISPYSFYVVERLDENINTYIYLDKQYCMVTGYSLIQVKIKTNINILFVCEPSRLVPNCCGSVIEELYKSKLNTHHKKFIVNYITGLIEKKNNTVTQTRLFYDHNEAYTYYLEQDRKGSRVDMIDLSFNTTMLPDKNTSSVNIVENHKVFMVSIINKSELVDGFVPIKFFIYDLARLKMQNMYSEVIEKGGKVYAIKSDALIINKEYKYDAPDPNLSDYQKIGMFKWEINKITLSNDIASIKKNKLFKHLIEIPPIENIAIEDEYDQEEFNLNFDAHSRVQVIAEFPGSGKTTALMNYAKTKIIDDKHTALFVVPYNEMCLTFKDFDSCTLHKLLGIKYDKEIGDVQIGNGINLDQYEIFIFDELYCHQTKMLHKIYKFMASYPQKKFFATGDHRQNRPIETLNVTNPDKYYQDIVQCLFPYQIKLYTIKRVNSPNDRKLYPNILNDIFNCPNDIFDPVAICRKYFKEINGTNDMENTYIITYLNFTAETINYCFHEKDTKNLNPSTYLEFIKYGNEKSKYYKGVQLKCKEHMIRSKKTLHVNNLYEIKSINIKDQMLNIFDISDSNKEDITIYVKDLKHFNFKYAHTCHSVQGTSKDAITLCDIDHPFVDKNWLWTAITRCRDLSKISFRVKKNQDDTILLKQHVYSKISSHKAEDNKKNRIFDNKDYVDYNEVIHLYNIQKGQCYFSHCSKQLMMNYNKENRDLQFSINRIDNNRAHIKGNCVISCLSCQHGYK
eukprot:Pompholyxophrys_sp_v1_NODE_6_length_8036_cov_9.951134.p1 type:complete len:1617 gc:universal NODE_6_length_8036_cov_9.951134:1979-6829(+)